MDDPTEATLGGTSVQPPAIPSGRRPGAGGAPTETFLPPPAGRAAFRQRFRDLGASVLTAGEEIPGPDHVPGPSPAEAEAKETPPRPTDPDLAHLSGLLTDLVEALQERGEAALELREGLPTFQVTLRAYCRGYLDGRRGAREG